MWKTVNELKFSILIYCFSKIIPKKNRKLFLKTFILMPLKKETYS